MKKTEVRRQKSEDRSQLFVVCFLSSVLCFLILSGCEEGNKHTTANIGDYAPKFTLSDLNNKTINLADYKGKKVMLNFWATWCPPCVNEMPLLQNIYNTVKEEGVEIIGINYNEDYERVKKFATERGITFAILIDSDLKVSMDYGVIGLPVTFFIDREGRIKEKFKGELNKKLIEDILNRF